MTLFETALDEALTAKYNESIPQTEEHEFSQSFEKKMNKLIKRRNKPYYHIINTAGKRIACIIVIIVLSLTTTLSVKAFREAFCDFFIEIFEKFSAINSIDKQEEYTEIKDIYEITYDLSGYEIEFCQSDFTSHSVLYRKDDVVIDFNQYAKGQYDMNINTEDTVIDTIEINGNEAIFYKDNHGYSNIIWRQDGYVFYISSNIMQDELIEIAKSVQKAE